MIKLSRREWIIAALLLALFLGAVYHMCFYAPLQEELITIEAQSIALDAELEAVAAHVAQMEQMRAALDQVDDPVTQIAPYDNKNTVLRQLNIILSRSDEYRLTFLDPVFSADGMVRRRVVMDLNCKDFASALQITAQLTEGPWRCLISDLAMTGTPDVMSGPVHVRATVTYFEHTELLPSRP